METVYDWVTVAIFAGLIVLFLQRSVAENPSDKLIAYLPPSIGCAGANYLGNNEQPILAVLAIIATLVYIQMVLAPFSPDPKA